MFQQETPRKIERCRGVPRQNNVKMIHIWFGTLIGFINLVNVRESPLNHYQPKKDVATTLTVVSVVKGFIFGYTYPLSLLVVCINIAFGCRDSFIPLSVFHRSFSSVGSTYTGPTDRGRYVSKGFGKNLKKDVLD